MRPSNAPLRCLLEPSHSIPVMQPRFLAGQNRQRWSWQSPLPGGEPALVSAA